MVGRECLYLKNTCEGNSIPTKFFHHFGLQYWSPVTVTVCSTVAFVVITTHKLHFMCPVFPNTARFLAQILYPSKLWKIPCFPQGSASLLACGIRAPDVNALVILCKTLKRFAAFIKILYLWLACFFLSMLTAGLHYLRLEC
jgi:hypothetical protein